MNTVPPARLARFVSCALLLLAGLVLLPGCSGKKDVGYLSGKATLGGQPLAQGSVLFEDKSKGVSVNAELKSDGSFTAKTFDLPGLPPGTYQVAVTPSTFGNGEMPLAVPPGQQAAPASDIPQRYRSTATSGLSVTVKSGTNPPLNIELTP